MNPTKNRLTGWVVRVVVLGLLAGGLIFAFGRVEKLRSEVLSLSQVSEVAAQQASRFEEAQRALERNRANIDRIQSHIVSREEISLVVGALETQARGRDITIEFSDVAEKQTTNPDGSVAEAKGPVRDIIISLTANGPPNELIAFLQAIEHLPFFAFVETWDFKATELSPRLKIDPEAPDETPIPVGRLSADVIVVVAF